MHRPRTGGGRRGLRGLYANHTLFARLAPGACAESLAFGPAALYAGDPALYAGGGGGGGGVAGLLRAECSEVFDREPGFLSTHHGDRFHDQWWLAVTRDGFAPLLHVLFRFAGPAVTLRQRFADAAGEPGSSGGDGGSSKDNGVLVFSSSGSRSRFL